jgi:hypothetical protein
MNDTCNIGAKAARHGVVVDHEHRSWRTGFCFEIFGLLPQGFHIGRINGRNQITRISSTRAFVPESDCEVLPASSRQAASCLCLQQSEG